LLAQKPFVVPIPGMDKIAYFEDKIKFSEVLLTRDDLQEIDNRLSQIKIQGKIINKDLLDLSEKK